MNYEKLSFSLVKRLPLIRDMDCVSMLIVSNMILKNISGKQYRDIVRNPFLISKEPMFWEESVYNLMKDIRPDYINLIRGSAGETEKYATNSLMGFDLALVFVGYGLKSKLRLDLKKTYHKIKQRGIPYLNEELKNIKEYEREEKLSFLPSSHGKRLTLSAMERMFSIPLYFDR